MKLGRIWKCLALKSNCLEEARIHSCPGSPAWCVCDHAVTFKSFAALEKLILRRSRGAMAFFSAGTQPVLSVLLKIFFQLDLASYFSDKYREQNIISPNGYNSMLETEANILEIWCTTRGTASSLSVLPHLGAHESWEFVSNLGSRCLCNCPGFRAECYFLALQLGMQHFCVMSNTAKYLEYNFQSCLHDFRAQVLFLEFVCLEVHLQEDLGFFVPIPKMQILRTPAMVLLSCSRADGLWLFHLLQMNSLINICF